MSLLSIVQSHCQINGLNVPNAVIGAQDTTTVQLLALLNELVELITDQAKFQGFTREAVHTLTVGEDQGAIEDIADEGYLWMFPGTFWNRTRNLQIAGPFNEVEWQQRKAQDIGGTYYGFRLRENHILINPAPASGGLDQVVFEYASSYGVIDNTGTAKSAFTADTDTFAMPERLLKKGLGWRWKHQKGLAYQLEEQEFWDMLNNYIARDKAARPLNLNGSCENDFRPGVFVPFWDAIT